MPGYPKSNEAHMIPIHRSFLSLLLLVQNIGLPHIVTPLQPHPSPSDGAHKDRPRESSAPSCSSKDEPLASKVHKSQAKSPQSQFVHGSFVDVIRSV